MHIEQSPEEIRKERVFSLEAENKRLDALNDEYIKTISWQAEVIRDLQIERHGLEASCAEEIRKTEEQLEFWKEQTILHRGTIDSQANRITELHAKLEGYETLKAKVGELKRYADLFCDDAIVCAKINNL